MRYPSTRILLSLSALALSSLALLPQPASAQAGDVKPGENAITWAVVEVPPISIFKTVSPTDLSDVADGSADIALRAIALQMPHYTHRLAGTSANRLLSEMAAGKPLCAAATVRTPEIERIAYLVSRGITPPSHLVVRKSDVARITKGESTVSLEELLQRRDVFGIIDAKRPQGGGIDRLTTQPQPQLKKVINAHFTSQYSSTMKNIDTGEKDYTIDLPYVVEFYNRKKVFINELVAIPIKEAAEPNTVYVGCTRSPWGARVIRDIDAAIRASIQADKGTINILSDQGIRNALLHWLPDSFKAEYASRIDTYFKQRLAEPPLAPSAPIAPLAPQ